METVEAEKTELKLDEEIVKQDTEEAKNENEDTNKNQNEPSSEHFKLEVKNLPKGFGFGQLRKFFSSLNLKFVKVKAPNNSLYAFVTFVNEEAREEAFKILNNTKYKGQQLEAVYSKACLDPLESLKRKSIENQNKGQNKIAKTEEDDVLTLDEKVQNSATPLWKLSYDEQIEKKTADIKQILRKTLWKMEKNCDILFYWLQKQRMSNDLMCCKLEEFVRSPVTDKYRNKCEFTIGYDANETNSVIGFRLGDYKSGSNEVVEPYCCKNISEGTKAFIRKFKIYIDQSKYKAFNVRTRIGNWRQLTIRSNENNEFLVIVIFDKHDLRDEEINEEKKLLAEFFKKDAEQENLEYKLKSLLFNLNTNKSGISKMDNLDKLLGEDYLYENLLSLKFRISPLAFFQANTKGAEVLYTKIGEICDIDENTVVLDICCGTGTIGLTLAKKAKLVVGVEIIPEAIEDAKLNSSLNNITNVEYHCGKAEDILPNLLKRFTKERVVAIVDPPRAGLHSKVVQALRRLDNLESLVYVSCNPELAMQNFIDLAREPSKTYVNNPFVPLKAIAVDMFPHTAHTELIIYFKRYSSKLISS